MRWVKVIVSVGTLIVLFLILPLEQMQQAWLRMSAATWVAVLGGFVAAHAIGVAKWRMVLNASIGRADLHLTEAGRCYAAGLFANLCLPTIVGGDVLRAGLAARATGQPQAAIIGGMVDRTIDIISLAILILVGGALVGGDRIDLGTPVLALLGTLVAGAAAVALAVAFRRPLERWSGRHYRHIRRGYVALRTLGRRKGVALSALLISVLIQSAFVLLNAWIGRVLGVTVTLDVWFLVWPLSKAIGLLPISIGGLGVREVALAGLLLPFGVPAATATVVSLTWQSILIGGGLLGGLLWWLSRSPNDKRQRAALFFSGRER